MSLLVAVMLLVQAETVGNIMVELGHESGVVHKLKK